MQVARCHLQVMSIACEYGALINYNKMKKEKDIQYAEYEYELDYCWDCAYDPDEDDEFQGCTDYKPWIYGRK